MGEHLGHTRDFKLSPHQSALSRHARHWLHNPNIGIVRPGLLVVEPPKPARLAQKLFEPLIRRLRNPLTVRISKWGWYTR